MHLLNPLARIPSLIGPRWNHSRLLLPFSETFTRKTFNSVSSTAIPLYHHHQCFNYSLDWFYSRRYLASLGHTKLRWRVVLHDNLFTGYKFGNRQLCFCKPQCLCKVLIVPSEQWFLIDSCQFGSYIATSCHWHQFCWSHECGLLVSLSIWYWARIILRSEIAMKQHSVLIGQTKGS